MEDKATRATTKVIALSVLFAALLWVLDSVVDYFFFSSQPFMNLLLYDIPTQDLFIRALIIFSFLAFGIIIAKVLEHHARTEEALGKSERKFRDLWDNIAELVQSVRPDGSFVYVNKAWLDTLGYTKEEVSKLSLFDIIHPDSQEHCRELLKYIIAGETIKEIKAKFIAKDGKIIEVEGSANCEFIEGEPVATRGIFRDVTERRKSEQELAELASFPQFNPHPILELDVISGKLTYMNPASRKEFPEIANPRAKHPIFKDFLTTALFLNKKHRKTDALNTDVGGKVFRQYISQALMDTRFRSYIVDITEHKKMDRLKDEFVGSVSHELRTPLSITKEAISLVLDRVTGDLNAKQEKILTAAKYNIERLTRIVNDLLDISKIELGRIDVNRKAVDLNDLIETVIFNFTPAVKEKKLELKTNLCNSTAEVYADPDRVIQVLNNLLNNALKFTKDGYIEIATSKEEDEFKCTVTDTGAGISVNDMQHVFDKFKQFGRISGPGEKGTGLGLSISKKIIEMHAGRIWATSRIDAGSKFMFTLPKYDIERIFKQHINERVNDVLKSGAKLSLLIASLPEYDKLEKEIGREKLQEIAKNIEAVLHGNLRAPKDVTLKGKGEIFVLLLNCTKENSYRVGGRLREALDEYLERQKLTDKIEVRFGYATCPDDAETDIGLIEHTKKIKRR